MSRSALPRVRKICMAFPEAVEIMFGGHAVWCKAPPGAQRVLVGAAAGLLAHS